MTVMAWSDCSNGKEDLVEISELTFADLQADLMEASYGIHVDGEVFHLHKLNAHLMAFAQLNDDAITADA